MPYDVDNVSQHPLKYTYDASEILKAMSNQYRLTILCHLYDQESSVTELQELLGIKQSVISQHLSVLRAKDMVSTRRDGQTIYYRVKSGAVRDVIDAICCNFPECSNVCRTGCCGGGRSCDLEENMSETNDSASSISAVL